MGRAGGGSVGFFQFKNEDIISQSVNHYMSRWTIWYRQITIYDQYQRTLLHYSIMILNT